MNITEIIVLWFTVCTSMTTGMLLGQIVVSYYASKSARRVAKLLDTALREWVAQDKAKCDCENCVRERSLN